MLKSLCYLSTATHRLDEAELAELLRAAREKNEAAGITGVLLYCDGNFMQYVEGPAGAIDGLWRALGSDPRHYGVVELFRQDIGQRVFTGWSMAFKAAEARQFDELLHIAREPVTSAHADPHPVVDMLRTFWLVNR